MHLGLGNFFRAHAAWYTDRTRPTSGGSRRSRAARAETLAADLNAQDGLYTLISRGADRDRFEVVGSLARAHTADEHEAWLGYFADPAVAAVTITVTEAGYLRGAGGGLDAERPEVAADLEALRRDPAALVRTTPARLLAGIAARRRADAGPLAVVSCDNVAGNGPIVQRVVRDAAELAAPTSLDWLDESVSFVTTMVDRITPRTGPDDVRAVLEGTGREDRAPVVTEPFNEWVLSGAFGAGRPPLGERRRDVRRRCHAVRAPQAVAAQRRPFAARLLRLDPRPHDRGRGRRRRDVPRRGSSSGGRRRRAHLDQPAEELAAYRAALLERFENARMHDRLDRIAMDGSQKLPIRIVPVLRAERAAGRVPEGADTRTGRLGLPPARPRRADQRRARRRGRRRSRRGRSRMRCRACSSNWTRGSAPTTRSSPSCVDQSRQLGGG